MVIKSRRERIADLTVLFSERKELWQQTSSPGQLVSMMSLYALHEDYTDNQLDGACGSSHVTEYCNQII